MKKTKHIKLFEELPNHTIVKKSEIWDYYKIRKDIDELEEKIQRKKERISKLKELEKELSSDTEILKELKEKIQKKK